jgi:hypothetical protein
LKIDEKGYPILPSWEDIEDKELLYKKLFIGKFMGVMYRAWTAASCYGILLPCLQKFARVRSREESLGQR